MISFEKLNQNEGGSALRSALKELETLLTQITFPMTTSTINRRGFPVGHRKLTFGIVRGRFNGITQLSNHSRKYPELYSKLLEFGKYIPTAFNAIHINHNVVCPKHYDSKNISESSIISCGDYTGCKLMIEDVEYDTYYKVVTFDGSNCQHWNIDDLVGNKYSLVYYKQK